MYQLELGCGMRITGVLVGMLLAGEAPVTRFDLRFVGCLCDLEDLVVVFDNFTRHSVDVEPMNCFCEAA